MTFRLVEAGEFMARRNGSVNPAKFPDEEFELHSIPAFDAGMPDFLRGSEIGSSKQIVQPNDVMISKIVPHIRRSSVVGPATGRRQIASSEWIVFRSEELFPHYLRHLLVSDDFNAKFMSTVSGVGGSLLRARPAQVAKIKIPVPPLAEQRRIAAILDKADALRAKRREAIAKLDQLLQSVFLDMFGDPVTNSFGWPTVAFTEVGEWKSGATPSKSEPAYWNGEFPWVSPKDMKVDVIRDAQDHVSELAFSRTNLRMFKPGHLLIVVRGMILAHSFPTAINNVSVAINQDMKAIEPTSSFEVMYLKAAIDAMKPRILSAVSSAGHGTCRLGAVDASEIRVPQPPKALQESFNERVAAIHQVVLSARKQSEQAGRLFQTLQHRAFSGTL